MRGSPPVVESDAVANSSRSVYAPGCVLAPTGVCSDAPPLHRQIVLRRPSTCTPQATGFELRNEAKKKLLFFKGERVSEPTRERDGTKTGYDVDTSDGRIAYASVKSVASVGWVNIVTPPPPHSPSSFPQSAPSCRRKVPPAPFQM